MTCHSKYVARTEVRKFIDSHYGGISRMACELGLTVAAIYRWEANPELMLKYSFKIVDTCGCTHMDIVEAVESQLKANA